MFIGQIATPSAHAIVFKVKPTKTTALVVDKLPLLLSHSVGRITVDLLTHHMLSFVGSESGIESIEGHSPYTTTGPDGRTRYYGWCYSINGEVPELMPDEAKLKSQSDVLIWFYAYGVKNADGSWEMCVPAE